MSAHHCRAKRTELHSQTTIWRLKTVVNYSATTHHQNSESGETGRAWRARNSYGHAAAMQISTLPAICPHKVSADRSLYTPCDLSAQGLRGQIVIIVKYDLTHTRTIIHYFHMSILYRARHYTTLKGHPPAPPTATLRRRAKQRARVAGDRR